MLITTVGPNLPRELAKHGSIVVHAAGCADLNRRPYTDQTLQTYTYTEEFDSVQAVVESFYGPEAGSFYAENGIPEESWDTAWEVHGYAEDFHFLPCTHALPKYRPPTD